MKRTPIKKYNRKRRKKLYERNFGDYAGIIRALPCCVCGNWPPSAPAHIKSRGAGGTAKDLVPLCRFHHAEQHQIGIVSFQKVNRIDLVVLAALLWAEHGEATVEE